MKRNSSALREYRAARAALGRVLALVGVKDWTKQNVTLWLDRLGIDHGISSGDLAEDVRRFMARSPAEFRESAAQDGPNVVFFGARALSGLTPFFTGMVSHALRLRNVRSHIVLCDEALPACESAAITDLRDWREILRDGKLPTCTRCFAPTARIINAFGLSYVGLSYYMDRQAIYQAREVAERLSLENILAFQLEGADLGEQVRTSLYRFFLVGTLEDDDRTLAIARRYLTAGIVVAAAARRLIERLEPVCVVTHHGIYLVSGTACAVARAMGVRVVAYDGTYRHNTVVISHGDTYHHELRSESWSYWENLVLSEHQNHRLDEYLRARRNGAAPQDYITYHPSPISDQERIRRELGLSTNQKIAVLFTNVAWDGRVHVPDGVFSGPVEWVLETLRYLGNRPDIRVVVRVHPAEVKNKDWVAQQRIDAEIRRAFSTLPSNVVVIPPESDINSYSLAELANVAIVYSTKMGLEAALMGIPLIIAGDAFYSRKGIGIEPKTREEYFAALDRIPQLNRITPEEMDRIRRYAYHYYFRRTIELPLPVPNLHGPIARSLTDLLPGKHRGLDVICSGILNGTPFIVDDE